ncbi:MAG TPA: N-acetylmuramic acid 6-phosphate etherase [Candidatus Dormibacteraeota bacterium]|nr:N-acetylmuramic acid 6-phosphate etherase [Candidatus Dormibacteraeota bacterium]
MKAAKTEQRNPRSRGLDRKSTLEILRVLNGEDARVARAVRRELPKIAKAVDSIVEAFRIGGRLIYVGAGTSGRQAVLDAAECPPTFGTPHKMVQAIIAGGERAMRFASEDAEDSAENGARDLRRAAVSSRDVVVGVSASGTTPFVLGALRFARKRGATTICVTSNPGSAITHEAQIKLVLDTGPEAVSGSTRLKAGTAQKMVLNMLSTASMVRIGRVYDNWMIHLALTNGKLQRRGVQMLQEISGASASAAEHAVRQAGHNLPAAIVMLKTSASARDAQRLLKQTSGNVRRAIELAESGKTQHKNRG